MEAKNRSICQGFLGIAELKQVRVMTPLFTPLLVAYTVLSTCTHYSLNPFNNPVGGVILLLPETLNHFPKIVSPLNIELGFKAICI